MRMMFTASTEYEKCFINSSKIEVSKISEVETVKGWVKSKEIKIGDVLTVLDTESDKRVSCCVLEIVDNGKSLVFNVSEN